jgi:fatty acid desaturase
MARSTLVTSGQNSTRDPDRVSKAAWRSIVEKCQQPSRTRALWQLVNTLIPVCAALVPDVSHAASFGQRFPSAKATGRERRSVWLMNLAVLGVAAMLFWIFGIAAYLLIQSTVMMVAGAAGVWLSYVQHQFEDVYWERGDNWNYTAAALQGSSF